VIHEKNHLTISTTFNILYEERKVEVS